MRSRRLRPSRRDLDGRGCRLATLDQLGLELRKPVSDPQSARKMASVTNLDWDIACPPSDLMGIVGEVGLISV